MLNHLINKIKATARLVIRYKKYTNQKSYYPEEPHKSKWRIFRDQLFFIWRYGNTEKYYYTYGFDRESMDLNRICNEFIVNEPEFWKKIMFHNDHPNGLLHGRSIVFDKFYFYVFLSGLNIPTPRIYYYTRKGKLLYNYWGDKQEGIDVILKTEIDAFAKPAGGQMGDGAFALKINGSSVCINGKLQAQANNFIQTITKTDYIIQERIIQHPEMNRLCSTAVNTIRLITVLSPDEEAIALRAGLRIGREGSNVDNCAKGGVFVGIDMNTGKLMKKGIIKPPYGTMVFQHPDNGVVFDGFEIPYFREAVEIAKKLHSQLYRIHSIGWDIAITKDGPVFIEGNSKWEVSGTQAAIGGVKFIEKYF